MSSLPSESEDLLLLTFLLDVLLLCAADCFLEFARANLLLVALCLSEHSLEGFYSLAHAGVQGSLDGVLVVVHILSEANQEGLWLIDTIL